MIQLRTKAYANEGKFEAGQGAMVDEYDNRSIIVIAKHHGKIVASLRLIISSKDQRLEHEHSLVLPSNFPCRSNTIEITRVCTHPDYRHGDLLEGLFRTSFIAMTHGRFWILGSSTDELLPIYEKMGFRKSKIRFIHQGLAKEHTLFLCNKFDVIKGKWVNPSMVNL